MVRLAAGEGDETEMVSDGEAVIVRRPTWRLMRGLEPLSPAVFDAWNGLLEGALTVHDRHLALQVVTRRDWGDDAFAWRIRHQGAELTGRREKRERRRPAGFVTGSPSGYGDIGPRFSKISCRVGVGVPNERKGGAPWTSVLARPSAVTVLGAGGLALAVGAVALVQSAQQLDREGKIVVAAGNPQYVELAERYKKDLRKYGVQLEVRERTTFKDKEGRIS